ncbi:MAG: glycosyltransferase family 2 protein [Thermomicrobiales bacterium]
MYKELTISVVIPCFNEEEGIAHVLRGMPAYVDEVIVVDNNSTDGTGDVARSLGAKVIHECRKGYGSAYQAGLPHATGDIIATVDGDGTYPSGAIAHLVDELLAGGLDFISASRFPLQDRRAMRRRNILGNLILTWTARVLFFFWFADSQSGMWVFRRSCLRWIRPQETGMAFSEEIKLDALRAPQVRFGERPIAYHERIGETKLFTWRDGFKNLAFLFRYRLRRSRESSVTDRQSSVG